MVRTRVMTSGLTISAYFDSELRLIRLKNIFIIFFKKKYIIQLIVVRDILERLKFKFWILYIYI
jgi:uncharacterized membrane protein